jgi:hypothetical protein
MASAFGGRRGQRHYVQHLTTTNLPAGFTASLSYTATDAILNLTATLGQPSGPSGPGALGTAHQQLKEELGLARTAENGFAAKSSVNKSAKVVLGPCTH